MLASFEQAFRLQQRDANTKESKDTVFELFDQSKDTVLELFDQSKDTILDCCLTIICDCAFLPTPAKYECQAPKIWVPRDQPVSGSSP